MKSWLATGAGQNYGKTLASGVVSEVAWELLGVTAVIAFAFAAIKFSLDRSQRSPFRVLPLIFGLALLLKLFGFFTDAIDGTMNATATRISDGGAFETFSQNFVSGVTKRLSVDVSQTSPQADSAASPTWDRIKSFWDSAQGLASTDPKENIALRYAQGALSGILATLSVLLAVVVFELFSLIRVVIFQVLYAVGPLVIALAALPGATGLLGRWFSAVFEVSSWQVIGAIMFELLAKSAAAQVYSGHDANFVALCVANVVFACAVLLIPAIAHRIIGSGFSSIGQAIQSSVSALTMPALAAAPAAAAGAATAAAPYVVKGAEAVANAAVPPAAPPLVSLPGVVNGAMQPSAPNAAKDGARGEPGAGREAAPAAAPREAVVNQVPVQSPASPNQPAVVPGRERSPQPRKDKK